MPTAPANRPQIKPGLRLVRRNATTVQIGLTPDVGVIVTGLAVGETELVERLDGTRRVSELLAWARTRGMDPARVPELLDLLGAAGVLAGPPADRAYLHQLGEGQRRRLGPDATAWSVVYADAGDGYRLLAERARRQVLVVGAGRLAEAVQTAAGRTGAHCTLTASLDANLNAKLKADPTADLGAEPRTTRQLAAYELVVLVGDDAVGAAAGATLLGAQRAHLAVVAGADRASVGPLVVPGRSACLRCVDLHRADRDSGWPGIAAQLDAPPPTPRGESSLTELVAALVALQVACWLDARRTPASVGATLTVSLPDGVSTRRAWPRHPRCGCSWLAASLPAPDRAAQSQGHATMGPWPTSPAAR